MARINGIPSRKGDGLIDINGAWRTLQKQSKKTGKLSGKAKTSIDVKADPLIINPDAKGAGMLYAAAIVDVMQEQLLKINKTASPETIARRQRYHRDGASRSYRKRYSGGRTGSTPPDPQSVKWGVDSGRLRGSVVAKARRSTSSSTGAVVTVNVVANRLEPISFGVSEFSDFRDELQRLAPAWAGKFEVDAQSRRTIDKVLKRIASDLAMTDAAKARALLRKRKRIIAQILTQATGLNIVKVADLLGI